MKLTLISKQVIVPDVWSYRFQPETPLSWVAGQFIRLEAPHAQPDSKGSKRFFTIASAPHEAAIQIITRLSPSRFKQALAQLKPGDTITLLDSPSGDFVWHDTNRPIVFVAQGIGITPFYSMIKSRQHAGLPLPIQLVYANQPGANIPLDNELAEWAIQHPEMTLHMVDAPITAHTLSAIVPEITQSLVYICGPKSLIQLLGPLYNLAASQLKHDRFSGYSLADY